jgi:hypothetical protein
MNVATIANAAPVKAPTKGKWLSCATSGVQKRPPRILIYGEEKVGKSTFAMGAPRTAYLSLDEGTSSLPIAGRLPTPANVAELRELLAELEAGPAAHGFETLVIDPVNWAEDLILRELLAEQPGKTMNMWGGGYGAGPKEARRRWRELLKAIERVWSAGLGIVLVAHRMVVEFKDPEGADYKRFVPAIRDDDMRGAVKQWVDGILHAQIDAYGRLGEDGKVKASGTGERILRTEWMPSADGGNRWELPSELPLSWVAFDQARHGGAACKAELLESIDAHLAKLGDEALTTKVRALLSEGKNASQIAKQLEAKVASKEAERVQ